MRLEEPSSRITTVSRPGAPLPSGATTAPCGPPYSPCARATGPVREREAVSTAARGERRLARHQFGRNSNSVDHQGRDEPVRGNPRQFPWQTVRRLSCTVRREMRERATAVGKRQSHRGRPCTRVYSNLDPSAVVVRRSTACLLKRGRHPVQQGREPNHFVRRPTAPRWRRRAATRSPAARTPQSCSGVRPPRPNLCPVRGRAPLRARDRDKTCVLPRAVAVSTRCQAALRTSGRPSPVRPTMRSTR